MTSSFFGFGSVLPRIHTDTKNTYPYFLGMLQLFFWLIAAFLFFNVVAFFGRFRAEFCGPRSVQHISVSGSWPINLLPISGDALSNRTSPIGPFRASSEDAVFVRCSRVEIAAARIAALPELVLLACCFGCSLQLRRRFCSNAARKVSSVTLCGAAGSGSCLAFAGRLAP